ncbi:MAG: hypothetical protein ACFFD1_07875 [Candidatus Thorarchaeota archaeon]
MKYNFSIKQIFTYGVYTLLVILFGLSVRLFLYGADIGSRMFGTQAINLSGLLLLLALAISFNIILIKAVIEIKKRSTMQNIN